MAFLSEHGVPSAHPVPDNQGHYINRLNNKPAVIVQCLPGASVDHPTRPQCQAVAAALARMHLAGAGFETSLGNKPGSTWWRTAGSRLQPHLDREDFALIEREIRFQSQLAHDGLIRGVIHADLFRDNALFVDSELTGIIDFYYACNDYLVYDLAITLNDWISQGDGSLDPVLFATMLEAYHTERNLSRAEREIYQGCCVPLRSGSGCLDCVIALSAPW